MNALIRCWRRWLGLAGQPVRPRRTHALLVLEGLETRETPSISATVPSLTLVEGTAASPVVATFTDTQATSVTSGMKALITWGDNTSSSGTITRQASNPHGFSVTGSKTYNSFGTYPLSVQITDGNASVKISGTVKVNDAALTATPAAITATEGTSFNGVVATFTDADPAAKVSLYTATITWGDNNISQGTITARSKGIFAVSGIHPYASAGLYTVKVQIADRGGSPASTLYTVRVADAPLTASPVAIKAIQGTPFSGVVATFTDAAPQANASLYSATITWGDNHTSPGTITANGKGGFTVSSSHTYASPAGFTVTVKISDGGGSTATVTNSATVASNPLTIISTTITARAGQTFSGVVASLTDSRTGTQAGQYTATINWGDSSTSPGTITANTRGGFDIRGSHTYARAGSYSIAVQVSSPTGIQPALLMTFSSLSDFSAPLNVNGKIFFTARTLDPSNPGNGTDARLYVSNGTPAGTVLLRDFGPAVFSPLTASNGKVYFATMPLAKSGPTPGFYVTDGTVAGTSFLVTPPGNPRVNLLTSINGQLFFTGLDFLAGGSLDTRLYTSDGTSAGTVLIADLGTFAAGDWPVTMTGVQYNGKFYLTLTITAEMASPTSSLYFSDGTMAGTSRLKNFGSNTQISDLQVTGGKLFFTLQTVGNTGIPDAQLYVSNGTLAGTAPVKDFGPGSQITGLDDLNGKVTFAVQTQSNNRADFAIYTSDGTATGTTLLKDLGALTFPISPINPGAAALLPVNETKVNGNIYFAAPTVANPSTSSGLYQIAGEGMAVTLVTDFGSGASIAGLTSSNGMLYFMVSSGTFNFLLYASNGTAAGTFQVQDLGTNSLLRALLAVNGTLYYIVTPNLFSTQTSTQLYALSGTNGGMAVMTAQTISSAMVTAGASS